MIGQLPSFSAAAAKIVTEALVAAKEPLRSSGAMRCRLMTRDRGEVKDAASADSSTADTATADTAADDTAAAEPPQKQSKGGRDAGG